MTETLCFLCEERTLDRMTEILEGLWPDRVIARTDLNAITVNECEMSFPDELAYLRYVCENPDAETSLYWKVPEARDVREIRGGYFIATADAYLVFGIDVDMRHELAVLRLLKERFSIRYAIGWGDTYPPTHARSSSGWHRIQRASPCSTGR